MTTTTATLDPKQTKEFVDRVWDKSIVPALVDYIRIPNKSPHFDKDWKEHGHMDKAVELIANWCKARKIAGLKLQIIEKGKRTPLICMEIPGQIDETVLLYGHLDKQPEMVGWLKGLGPWTPVIKGDKLYGRGGADDGYAAFASLCAIESLQAQGVPHARCVVLIEAGEESGSPDLPFYVDFLKKKIGTPSLIVCLDSGCANYEQLWGTTSLRGLVGGKLTVEVLREGVHSGSASGIVPSSFRILRQILSRIDKPETGEVLVKDFFVEIPRDRLTQAKATAKVLGDTVWTEFPFVEGMQAMSKDNVELILNRTWRPTLSITGADDMPAIANAGNVLRPRTSVKVSLRLPPTKDGEQGVAKLKEVLEKDPPYGAKVTFTPETPGGGWNAPTMPKWLEEAIDRASRTYYGKPAMYMGEGGSIPFMGMLGAKFPKAQFLITGVLGPQSNAHGPNEFLHIPYAKKLNACVASILAAHGQACSG